VGHVRTVVKDLTLPAKDRGDYGFSAISILWGGKFFLHLNALYSLWEEIYGKNMCHLIKIYISHMKDYFF
jgi:hypothetical protein